MNNPAHIKQSQNLPSDHQADERVRERKDKVNAVETLGYDRWGCYRLDYGSRIDFVVA